MTVNPLVSVIVPCFNAERWVEETIASVEAQTYAPIELIVVDDGSTDACASILDRMAAAGRIILLRQTNQGQNAAFNAGLALSTGEYIQYLDADDVLDSGKIAAQMQRLAGSPKAIATCAWGRFYTVPNETVFAPELCWKDCSPAEWLGLALWDGGGMLFPALWLLPRSICVAAGPWDERLSVNTDGEYFTRVLCVADQVLFCEDARACYRSGIVGSMSSHRDAKAWQSYAKSLHLVEAHVSDMQTPDIRRGLSYAWQRLAYACHPYDAALADDALRSASALSDSKLPISGGWRFRSIAAILGWKFARRLQHLFGRL